MKLKEDTLVILPNGKVTNGERIIRALALEEKVIDYVKKGAEQKWAASLTGIAKFLNIQAAALTMGKTASMNATAAHTGRVIFDGWTETA